MRPPPETIPLRFAARSARSASVTRSRRSYTPYPAKTNLEAFNYNLEILLLS